jgi:hypothetical protein
MKKILPSDFWDRFSVGDACWEWQGYLSRHGYGRFYIDGKYHLAHRWMYAVWYGVDPGDQHVLHSCDNPRCVSPAHLSLGDQKENMLQMFQRGRSNKVKGEDQGLSKLTEDKVLQIRARWEAGESQSALGREYGVSKTAIRFVVRRYTWKHV